MWSFSSTPSFADLDGDGDLDAFIGELLRHYQVLPEHRQRHQPGFYPAQRHPQSFQRRGCGIIEHPQLRRPGWRWRPGRFHWRILWHDQILPEHRQRHQPGLCPAHRHASIPSTAWMWGTYSTPSFADLDGDGDLDAFIGENDGIINYFQNTGSATSPAFSRAQRHPQPLQWRGCGILQHSQLCRPGWGWRPGCLHW